MNYEVTIDRFNNYIIKSTNTKALNWDEAVKHLKELYSKRTHIFEEVKNDSDSGSEVAE